MKINNRVGSVHIYIDTGRIDGNIREAQKKLNEQIVADCTPLIPFQQGALRNSVNYPNGIYGGEIEWDTPYAHYQYMNNLYLTEDGRSWANKGEKKYPTNKPLSYHTPGTTGKWFEVAKEQHLQSWVDLVKKTIGKE